MDEEIEGFLDLLSNSRGPAVAVVQIEREVTQSMAWTRRATTSSAARFSATNSTRRPSAIARPEDWRWSATFLFRADLRARRSARSASATADTWEPSAGMGHVAASASRSSPTSGRHRVTEFLGRCVGQMVGQRRGEQRLPVLRQVLPQPELRELQQSQTRSGLHPKRVPAADEGFADSTDDLVERDALVVAGQVGQEVGSDSPKDNRSFSRRQ